LAARESYSLLPLLAELASLAPLISLAVP